MSEEKSKAGRKSGEGLKQWVEGLDVFAGQTGFTRDQMAAVRKTEAGAQAFVRNRVEVFQFNRAFNALVSSASELPDGFISWKEFGESRRAKISDVELQEKKGLLGATSEFKRQAGEAVGHMFSELERRDRECPPAFAGRSAVEIAERMEADTKAIKKNLAAKFEGIAP